MPRNIKRKRNSARVFPFYRELLNPTVLEIQAFLICGTIWVGTTIVILILDISTVLIESGDLTNHFDLMFRSDLGWNKFMHVQNTIDRSYPPGNIKICLSDQVRE